MSNNKIIRAENKQELRQLENMYVNSQIDNLDLLVQEKKDELTDKLIKYQEDFKVKKYNKDGYPYYTVNINPIVIQRYFFKTINPIGNREPAYNAEKLAIVWDLYNEIVLGVNAQIGEFIPNLTGFCTFAGITLSTFKSWKRSNDPDMRIIVEKINDMCFDTNVTMAQMGSVRERSTIYRMKSEQERAEKEQPQIHIHNEGVDFNAIDKRLKELQGFNERKSKVIEVQKIEE
jgi:hypothetical protein